MNEAYRWFRHEVIASEWHQSRVLGCLFAFQVGYHTTRARMTALTTVDVVEQALSRAIFPHRQEVDGDDGDWE